MADSPHTPSLEVLAIIVLGDVETPDKQLLAGPAGTTRAIWPTKSRIILRPSLPHLFNMDFQDLVPVSLLLVHVDINISDVAFKSASPSRHFGS
jgi:hypothetical protein